MTKDQAHRRLLNAVISFTGADQNGSRTEVRAAAIELEAATKESQNLLYPEELAMVINFRNRNPSSVRC